MHSTIDDVRWLVAVLTVVGLTGCAAPDALVAGQTTPYELPMTGDGDHYGTFGITPLKVVRGKPEELTGTLVDDGEPAPAGTPYYLTIGFASGRPSPVNGIDSLGGEHPALRVVADGGLRPCVVDTSWYAQCRIYVMPPGTELIGLALGDVS